MIIFLQMKQGKALITAPVSGALPKMYMSPPSRLTPARAALMMAFCSAWTDRHSS